MHKGIKVKLSINDRMVKSGFIKVGKIWLHKKDINTLFEIENGRAKPDYIKFKLQQVGLIEEDHKLTNLGYEVLFQIRNNITKYGTKIQIRNKLKD